MKGFKDVLNENGSSQGQNMALDFLVVPSSLDSGLAALDLDLSQS